MKGLLLLLAFLAIFLSWPIEEVGGDDNAYDIMPQNAPEFATNAMTSYSTFMPEPGITESPIPLKLHWETVAEGKVGYYGGYFKEGNITRSGRPYSSDGDILAVDSALYSMLRLQGQGVSPQIILENLETGDRWIVYAADSGLFPAGYIGDLGDNSWLLVSGKPLGSGVFRGRLLIGVVR